MLAFIFIIMYMYKGTKLCNIQILVASCNPFYSCTEGYGQSLQISERNSSRVFVQLLRGRDGLPGRDGAPGPAGPPGEAGAQGQHGLAGRQSGGTIYIRWGKSSCPGISGTERVYEGIAAGSYYNEGGGSNYLCLPKFPQYKSDLKYRSAVDNHAQIHGVEYELPLQGSHDHNAPCAVCHVSTRSQFSSFQPGIAVHKTGPQNTMATSCLKQDGTSVQVLYV